MENQEKDEQSAMVGLGQEYTETFHVESKLDPSLNGDITVRLPNGRDEMRIAINQAKFRDGVPAEQLDPLSYGFVVMVSMLSVVVTEAPSWWFRTARLGDKEVKIPAPELLRDIDLLWEIHGRYAEWRNTFPDRRRDEGDRHADEGSESVASEPDPASESVQQHDSGSDGSASGVDAGTN